MSLETRRSQSKEAIHEDSGLSLRFHVEFMIFYPQWEQAAQPVLCPIWEY